MAEQDDRRARGAEQFEKIYHGLVPIPKAGVDEFADIMLSEVFAEVWSRPALSIKERRLLIIGVAAAMGQMDIVHIQVSAALKGGELNAEQAREIVLQLAQYAGYPRVGGMRDAVEKAIANHAKKSE